MFTILTNLKKKKKLFQSINSYFAADRHITRIAQLATLIRAPRTLPGTDIYQQWLQNNPEK